MQLQSSTLSLSNAAKRSETDPTQLTNAVKRSETDPPKAQAQQFSLHKQTQNPHSTAPTPPLPTTLLHLLLFFIHKHVLDHPKSVSTNGASAPDGAAAPAPASAPAPPAALRPLGMPDKTNAGQGTAIRYISQWSQQNDHGIGRLSHFRTRSIFNSLDILRPIFLLDKCSPSQGLRHRPIPPEIGLILIEIEIN